VKHFHRPLRRLHLTGFGSDLGGFLAPDKFTIGQFETALAGLTDMLVMFARSGFDNFAGLGLDGGGLDFVHFNPSDGVFIHSGLVHTTVGDFTLHRLSVNQQ
jgi:hypothetical protein